MSETTLSMEQIEGIRRGLKDGSTVDDAEIDALCNMAIGNAERVLRFSITAPGEWEIISYPNPNNNIIRRVR